MQAIYHTTISELNFKFFEGLKKQFKNAKVDIVIQDSDETDYLNSSTKNKEFLEIAIKEVENSKFIEKSWDDYNEWSINDKKIFKKIQRLIKETIRNPFGGIHLRNVYLKQEGM